MKSAITTAAIATLALAFLFGCSEKCGNKEYDPDKQFCADNKIYERCDGKEFDSKTQFCYAGKVTEKCDGEAFNMKTQFCNGNALYEKCGGNEFDPAKQLCIDEEIKDYPKCGGKEYNPSMQFCESGSLYDLCGGENFKAKTQSCKNGVIYDNLSDARDGKAYKYLAIKFAAYAKGQSWMAENLNYDAEGSACYKDDCEENGRLYDWNAAMNVCPQGWRLPRKIELSDINDKQIDSVFLFSNRGNKYYWTGDTANGSEAYGFIKYRSYDMDYSAAPKTDKLLVRCVKDFDFTDRLCGGKKVNKKLQFCHNDKVANLCNGEEYDLDTHSCHNGEKYETGRYFIHDNKIIVRCGANGDGVKERERGGIYNPKKELCFMTPPGKYTDDDYFAMGKIVTRGEKILSACDNGHGYPYDPETQGCCSINDGGSVVYDLNTEICGEDANGQGKIYKK